MAQLTLVKLHEDGSSLLLRAKDGAEFHLPVCADLRAAVARGSQPPRNPDKQSNPPTASQEKVMPQPAANENVNLRPAEIQARLRAGATVEELAAITGTEAARIKRFEHAIVSEREYVIASIRSHRIDGGTETVGELADARLRARGVEPNEATWLARREAGSPWQIEVRFPAADDVRCARWNYDLRSHHLTALDDEARWLSQPDEQPITAEVVAVPTMHRSDALDQTSAILEDLAARRGKRNSEPVATEPKSTRGSAGGNTVSTPKAPSSKAPAAGKSAAPITAELNELNGVASGEPKPITTRAPIVEIGSTNRTGTANRSARGKRTKGTRTAMPSWDDIVLGPKRED